MTDKNTTVFAIEVQGADDVVKAFAATGRAAEGAGEASRAATTAAADVGARAADVGNKAAAGAAKAADSAKSWQDELKKTGNATGELAGKLGQIAGSASGAFGQAAGAAMGVASALGTGGVLGVVTLVTVGVGLLKDAWDAAEKKAAEAAKAMEAAEAKRLKHLEELSDGYVHQHDKVTNEQAVKVAADAKAAVDAAQAAAAAATAADNEYRKKQYKNSREALADSEKVAKLRVAAEKAAADATEAIQLAGEVGANARRGRDEEAEAAKIEHIARLEVIRLERKKAALERSAKLEGDDLDARIRNTKALADLDAQIVVAQRMAAPETAEQRAEEDAKAAAKKEQVDADLELLRLTKEMGPFAAADAKAQQDRADAQKRAVAALQEELDLQQQEEAWAIQAEENKRKADQARAAWRVSAAAEVANAEAGVGIAAEERRANQIVDLDARAAALRKINAEKAALELAAVDAQRDTLLLTKTQEEADEEIAIQRRRTNAAIALREQETEAAIAALKKQQQEQLRAIATDALQRSSQMMLSATTSIVTSQMAKLGEVNRENYQEMIGFSEKTPAIAMKMAQGFIAGIAAQAAVEAINESAKGTAALAEYAFSHGADGFMLQSAMSHFGAAALFGGIAGVSAGGALGLGMMRGSGGIVGLTDEEKKASGAGGASASASGSGGSVAGPSAGRAATSSGNGTQPVVVNFVYEAGSINAGDTARLGRSVARGVRAANRDGFARRQMQA